jgi:hypothetical protein
VCVYVFVFCHLNWVCWVRGNFSGGLGHIFSACVTPLCGVPGRYNFIWALCGWRDCTDFLFLWLCCSGYGTVEMVKGVVRFFLLSSVCCQFSWRLDVCGRNFVLYILIFFGSFVVFSRGFLFCKLLIFLNLLQVVPAESELGGGPGTSA